jgi:hypothetical protein
VNEGPNLTLSQTHLIMHNYGILPFPLH